MRFTATEVTQVTTQIEQSIVLYSSVVSGLPSSVTVLISLRKSCLKV